MQVELPVATLPIHRDGRWELRFVVDSGAERFTKTLELEKRGAVPQ